MTAKFDPYSDGFQCVSTLQNRAEKRGVKISKNLKEGIGKRIVTTSPTSVIPI
jgi:hypothetical protein